MIEFAQTVNAVSTNPAGILFKDGLRIKGDPQTRRPDITRAREVLGWEPKIDLEEGLRRTLASFAK
jgi:dTDP-glucose 4,6-dehydratase